MKQKPYNLPTLRKPPVFVLISVFLAALAVPQCSLAQPQAERTRSTEILLVMPFENISGVPGIDWIGEAFPEILGNRLNSASLFVVSRADRLSALDHLGLPAAARPSRATTYQVAQQLDADYVLMGDYRLDGATISVRAHVIDMDRLRLSPELAASGPLTGLITVQTSLAWDVLKTLNPVSIPEKQAFVAQFPPVRLDGVENYIRGVLAGNKQEKIKYLEEAVRVEPSQTLAMLVLGKTYYENKDYEPAMSWLVKIPNNDPNLNEAQFYLGLSAFYAGHMDKAETAFHSLASRLPLTEVYNNLGVAEARLGNRQARGYFKKSVQTDPNDPDYHFNLAVALYRDGQAPEAARELKEVLALHADVEAREFLDAIVARSQPARLPLERIKPNYDESSFRQLAMEIENVNEARLGKTDSVSHAAFHVQRGRDLLDKGLTGEAEKQFREAVILDPTNAGAHAGLARVLESNQDSAAARNEARASLRLGPSAEAYLVLARLDLADNNSMGAQQNVDHALALDPANAAATALKHDIAAGPPGTARPPQP
jgi:tetratricopeptide (TPR) repeat protein